MEQTSRGYLRRLTHLIVLVAAVVPTSVTLASAHAAPPPLQRIELGLPASPADGGVKAEDYNQLVSVVIADPPGAAPEVVPPPPPPPPPPSPKVSLSTRSWTGTRGQFPWGYCTWYVASRRSIPWSGNAGAWYAAAQGMGFAVGSTPRPGAIMVSREGAVGHVAIVESVDGNSFVISEMNFKGFGVVDQRHLTLGQVPLIGFIY